MARKQRWICSVIIAILGAGCGSGGAEPEGWRAEAGGDTLFFEGFESGDLSAWDDGVDPARHRVVHRPGLARSGSFALEIAYPPGRDGGWLTRFLPPGHDSIYLQLWVRFEEGWRGSTKLVALYGSREDDIWSGFGKAGRCPDGTDFFATMIVTESRTGDPGRPRFYTYYPGMRREPDGRTCWGRFGDGSEIYTKSGALRPGEWHRLEFRVRLNEPGRSDGVQEFWIDGELVGRWEGLELRRSSVLELNALQLTASAEPTALPRRLYVDDIVVMRAPPAVEPAQLPTRLGAAAW